MYALDTLPIVPKLSEKQLINLPTLETAIVKFSEVYNFRHHPYFIWMQDAATTREEFRKSQLPFRFAVESFSQALAAVLAKIPSLEMRLPLFDIQFSNISDWMPLSELHKMLANAVDSLKPGGALVGRRLNGDHHLASIMSEHLTVDEKLSTQLHESDRSFFYREVVVGFLKGE